MAKKSTRARPRPAGPTTRTTAASPAVTATAVVTAAEAAPGGAAPKKKVDFASEYRYVLGDLRKMGMIAVAMFAVLILLSFAIR